MPSRSLSSVLSVFLPLLVLLSSCGSPPVQLPALQWESLQGPFARNISTMVAFPGDRLLYAALTSGEIALSTDGGRSWAYRTPTVAGEPVSRFYADPADQKLLYAAGTAGFFKSTDSARSWIRISPVLQEIPVRPVTVFAWDPWRPDVRFLGTGSHGLFRSTDGGRSWNAIEDSVLGRSHVADLLIDAERPDRMFAALGVRGIVRSDDGGLTWKALSGGSAGAGPNVTHLLLHPKNGAIVLFGTDAGSIHRSSNGGDHWSPVRPAGTGDAILSFWSDPARPTTVWAGTHNGLLQSSDFGESWRPRETLFPRIPVSFTASSSSPPVFYAFSEAIGLRASTDRGNSWLRADEALGGATPSALVAHPGGRDIFLLTDKTVIRYSADSSAWMSAGEGLTGGVVYSLAIDQRSAQTAYATSASGPFRSTDGGRTWSEFARMIPNTPRILVPHPWFPTRLLASGTRGIFVSTDRGRTWKESRPAGKLPAARSFTFRSTNAGRVYAAADGPTILHTYDGGITWESTRYGLGDDTLACITLDDADPQICYAWTTNGGCYRSLDGGLEWSRFAPPWGPRDQVRLAVDPENAVQIVALVNDRTVMLSTTGGTSWHTAFDMRLPGIPVALGWHAGTSTLYVGLKHRSVYRLRLEPVLHQLPGFRRE